MRFGGRFRRRVLCAARRAHRQSCGPLDIRGAGAAASGLLYHSLTLVQSRGRRKWRLGGAASAGPTTSPLGAAWWMWWRRVGAARGPRAAHDTLVQIKFPTHWPATTSRRNANRVDLFGLKWSTGLRSLCACAWALCVARPVSRSRTSGREARALPAHSSAPYSHRTDADRSAR